MMKEGRRVRTEKVRGVGTTIERVYRGVAWMGLR